MALRYPLYIDKIGILIEGDYELTAYCYDDKCRHNAKLDLEQLAAQLGRDHSTMHDDLVPKLRCSKCGGKNIGLRLSPPTGTPGELGRVRRPNNTMD